MLDCRMVLDVNDTIFCHYSCLRGIEFCANAPSYTAGNCACTFEFAHNPHSCILASGPRIHPLVFPPTIIYIALFSSLPFVYPPPTNDLSPTTIHHPCRQFVILYIASNQPFTIKP